MDYETCTELKLLRMCAFVCVCCVFASSWSELALVFDVHVFVVVCIHFFVCIFVVVLLFVFVLVLVQGWSRSELCLCRAGPGAEVTGGNWCDEHVWPPAPPAPAPALPPLQRAENTHMVWSPPQTWNTKHTMPGTVAARPQVPASRTSWVSWGARHCSLQRQRQTVRSEITFTLQDIQTLYEAWNAPLPPHSSSQKLQLDTIWNKFLRARECSTHCHNLKKFDLEWLTLERWASPVKIVIKVSLSQVPLYQTRIIQPFMQELAVLNKNLAANPRAYMLITLWAFSVSLFVSMLLSVCVAYFEFTKSPRPKRTLTKQPTLC